MAQTDRLKGFLAKDFAMVLALRLPEAVVLRSLNG